MNHGCWICWEFPRWTFWSEQNIWANLRYLRNPASIITSQIFVRRGLEWCACSIPHVGVRERKNSKTEFFKWLSMTYSKCYLGCSDQYVAEHVVEREKEVEIRTLIWFYSFARSEPRVTNSPLKRRQLRFNYFVNKQNESLELLSLHFRCLAGSANKNCVISITRTLWAMKGK